MSVRQMTIYRGRFFINNWDATVTQCEKKLEPDDLKQVRQITSWDALQSDVLSDTMPYEIAIIGPTLGHLRQFTNIFDTELAPGLEADFFWGILNLLLRVSCVRPSLL